MTSASLERTSPCSLVSARSQHPVVAARFLQCLVVGVDAVVGEGDQAKTEVFPHIETGGCRG